VATFVFLMGWIAAAASTYALPALSVVAHRAASARNGASPASRISATPATASAREPTRS